MPVGIRKPLSVGLVSLSVLVGGLVFASAPAFAAAPEKPEVSVEDTTAVVATPSTEVVLHGVLDPGLVGAPGTFELGEYEFLYEAGATCTGGSVVPTPPGLSLGGGHEELPAETLTGLTANTEYTVCLQFETAGGTTPSTPVTFTTALPPAAAPTITAEQVTHITETGATLQASIDPDGAETTYHFEYDTTPYTSSAPHGTSVTETKEAEVSIGAGTSPVPVEVQLKGLTPGATYYYRVLATNSQSLAGGTDGPNKAFTTTAAPGTEPPQSCPNEQRRAEQPYGAELPDCRAYELVSPTSTHSGNATESRLVFSRASTSDEEAAIAYPSLSAFGAPAGDPLDNELLSRRGPEGWSTQSIVPPEYAPRANTFDPYEDMVFTPTLSRGVAFSDVQLPLGSSEAPAGFYEDYLANFASGSYQWVSRYGSPIDQEYLTVSWNQFVVVGASTDLSHVVYSAGNYNPPQEGLGLYEWVDGNVVRVDVTNQGESIGGSAGTNGLTVSGNDVWHAVSASGSRVFFTGPNADELYVRENVGQEQSPVEHAGEADERCTDPALACTVAIAEDGRFWGANSEGTKVFYTKNGDLYQFELPLGETAGSVTDLTPGAEVQGVAQISEDGGYVYFVANGALGDGGADGASQGNCKLSGAQHEGGACNLYVWHAGETKFIATLTGTDYNDWSAGEHVEPPPGYYREYASPATNTAAVASDGMRFAFLSQRSLTGYDNRDAGTGEPDDEVYLYDAETNKLVCASCNPSGARPTGSSQLTTQSSAADVGYKTRNVAENGALFFDSEDALVTHASDGRRNVYEYEDGHIYPISDVAGDYESFLLDASPRGNNVFFATADQLVGQDAGNNRIAVYDARVGGGFPAPAVTVQCTNADSCKQPTSPQPAIYGAPASATFSGAGNPAPPPPLVVSKKVTKKVTKCKKNFVRNKRGKCVKKKARKSTKAKKSSYDRRASR